MNESTSTPLPTADDPRPESASAAPTVDGPATGSRLEYDGTAGPVAKIAVSNALLTLATLGAYRFWGKTRMRRHLWSRASFLGDRAEYTGTGRELLLGFLVALAALALLAGAVFGIELATGIDHPLYWTANGAYSLVVLFLVFVAEYRARRYRLSRTEWRSIRFVQDGSSLRYALLALGWAAVTLVSLGLAYPVYRTRLQRYRAAHTRFGDRRFEFDGRARKLLGAWLLAWLFFVPTLGLTYVWYRVREFRYFAGKTRCGALSFASDLGAGATIRIAVVYSLIAPLPAIVVGGPLLFFISHGVGAHPELARSILGGTGYAAPFLLMLPILTLVLPAIAVLRMLFLVHPLFRRVLRSVSVTGEEDFAAIAQRAQSMQRQGEGLADMLDVGAV